MPPSFKQWLKLIGRPSAGDETYIQTSWVVGGRTGGSWRGGKHYRREAEPEPEFEELDAILEKSCPGITFLQYKRLCSVLIEKDSSHDNDYYGNCADYAIKKFDLRRLYEHLRDNGLLQQGEEE